MIIKQAGSDAEIARCFPVMAQLRPHLDEASFTARVRAMEGEGYRLAFLEDDGEVRAVAGLRVHDMLAVGRVMYVDDLVADEKTRGTGYGSALFDWLIQHARDQGCAHLMLDSAYHRKVAHRFYNHKGLTIDWLHFGMSLDT